MDQAKLAELYHQGWKNSDLAEFFECSRPKIYAALRDAGLDPHASKIARAMSEEELIRLLKAGKPGWNEIQERSGCHRRTVYRAYHRLVGPIKDEKRSSGDAFSLGH